MSNTTFYSQSSGTDSAPQSISLTGTVTTSGVYVTGIGTAFLTELHNYDWLLDATTNKELRKVISVQDDTHCIIDSKFTADITIAQALRRVIKPAAKEININIPTGATGNINGQAVTAPEVVPFTGENKYLDPLVLEVTGGTFKVNIVR